MDGETETREGSKPLKGSGSGRNRTQGSWGARHGSQLRCENANAGVFLFRCEQSLPVTAAIHSAACLRLTGLRIKAQRMLSRAEGLLDQVCLEQGIGSYAARTQPSCVLQGPLSGGERVLAGPKGAYATAGPVPALSPSPAHSRGPRHVPASLRAASPTTDKP